MSVPDYVDYDEDAKVILTGLPGRLAKYLDMPAEEVAFLLNKVGESKTIQSTVETLLIKLKLEYSEELTRERARFEADRVRRISEAEQRKLQDSNHINRTLDYIRQRRLANRLEYYMDRKPVYSVNDVPEELRDIYEQMILHGCISKPWFSRPRVSKSLPIPDYTRKYRLGTK